MKKPKRVNFELIKDQQSEPYLLLAEVRNAHRQDLDQARIALAWRIALKPDPDGHLLLGKCLRVSDLQKEFADFDFIILLNREVWNSVEWDRDKKVALLHHELCHAEIAYDEESGTAKIDSRGRTVYRTRRHDIEEFSAVVESHGCYKKDLEAFARVILQKQAAPLFHGMEKAPEPELVDKLRGALANSAKVAAAHLSQMLIEDGGTGDVAISGAAGEVIITKERADAFRSGRNGGGNGKAVDPLPIDISAAWSTLTKLSIEGGEAPGVHELALQAFKNVGGEDAVRATQKAQYLKQRTAALKVLAGNFEAVCRRLSGEVSCPTN